MAKYGVLKNLVALPVMLHEQEEIAAFYSAKERIESMCFDKGVQSEVQVFLYLHPHQATKPENMRKQIENQRRYNLPLAHVQFPVQGTNSMDYDAEEARQFGIPCRLEELIKHAVELTKESPTIYTNKPDFDIHPGVLVVPELNEEHPAPGVYSVEGFLKRRREITDRVKTRFSYLSKLCGQYGFNLILETEPTVIFESLSVLEKQTGLAYLPFSDPFLRKEISPETTFDSVHFAATTSVQDRFLRNGVDSKELFEVLNIDSWEEYNKRFGNMGPYLSGTRALHLGNTTGIGVHLSDESEIERWGNGSVEGILEQEDFNRLKRLALEEKLPMVLEVEYDIKNIPVNCFSEADIFLKRFNLI